MSSDPTKPKRGRPRSRASILADQCGLTSRQLRALHARGCPLDSVESVRKWREENLDLRCSHRHQDAFDAMTKPAAPAPAEEKPVTIADARLLLLQMQAEREKELARKYRIHNEQRSGVLVSRDDVQRDTAIALARLRNRLEALGQRVAVSMPAELKLVVQQQVDLAVRVMLSELVNDMNELFPEGDLNARHERD